MTREIKFRAWDEGNKQMVYPLPEGTLSSGALLLRWDDNHLMQYTGLRDKDGKEIYEGDIIKVCNGSINCVEWMDKPCEVKYFLNSGYNLPLFMFNQNGESDMDSTHWCEVIGNIYEHPNLIDLQ